MTREDDSVTREDDSATREDDSATREDDSATREEDISIDSNQVIDEAQCECGAGQGPTTHCKHVDCMRHSRTEQTAVQ